MTAVAAAVSAVPPPPVWRNVTFFNTQTVKGALQQLPLTSLCAAPQYTFAGEYDGRLTLFDAGRRSGTHEPVLAFQAYTGPISHMKYIVARNILLTVGDDDALNTAIVRVWDVAQVVALHEAQQSSQAANGSATAAAGPNWRPPCVEHRLFSGKYPAPTETVPLAINFNAELLPVLQFSNRTGGEESIPATSLRTVVVSIDVAEDLKVAAIALTSNDVVMLYGELDMQRSVPRIQRLRSRVAKGRVTFIGLPSSAHVHIRPTDKSGTAPTASASGLPHRVLFTVYEDAVTAWRLGASGKSGGASGALEAVEYPCPVRFGAAAHCACLDVYGRLLVASSGGTQVAVVGQRAPPAPTASASSSSAPPAVTGYDPTEARAVQLMDIDGAPKRQLLAHRDALVVLAQHPNKSEQFTLQCYDIDHHLRMLTRAQESCVNCAFVVSDRVNRLLVFVQESPVSAGRAAVAVRHSITQYSEISTQGKLDLLFHKECYGVAKDMAKQLQGIDPTLLQGIQQRYGDYLYSKGRFDEAMTQYMETIGALEPSYVIRKYITAQHIPQLTRYLEELHHERHGHLANVSHTTLLLSCYIKQHALTTLMAFVHRDDVRFDPHVAIQVCREGGCDEAALYIAEKYAKHYDYIRIQLHDLEQPREALDHLRTLGVDDAEDIVKRVGKELIAAEPLRTTQTLTELCVHWGGPARRLRTDNTTTAARAQRPPPPHRTHARDLLHIFVESPVCLLHFLRAVLGSGVLDEDVDEEARDQNRVLFNTLLELYLMPTLPPRIVLGSADDTTTPDVEEAEATAGSPVRQFPVEPLARRQEQAMSLLEAYSGRYDDYVALGLLYQYPFDDGKVFMLQRLQLSAEVMNHYGEQLETSSSADVRREAKAKLFEACQAHEQSSASTAASSREVWMGLLAQLVRSPSTDWQDVVKVLDHIESHKLLSPVVTMEVLSSPQSRLQLRTVREYCQRVMRAQLEKRKALQALTARRRQALQKLQEDIHTLQTTAVAFTSNVCVHCGEPLDLPVVHFLCRHSFHLRCLGVSTECNVCAPQHQKVLDSVKEHQRLARDPRFADSDPTGATEFFHRLQEAEVTCASAPAGAAGGEGAEASVDGVSDGFAVLTDFIARGALCADPHMSTQTAGAYSAAVMAQQGASQAPFVGEAALYDDDGKALDPASLEVW